MNTTTTKITTTKRKQKWLVLVLITAYFERLRVLLYAIFFSSVPSSPSSPSLLADLPLEAGLAMESEQQQFVFTKENFNNPKLPSGLKIMQVRYVKWCKSRTLCNRNYIKWKWTQASFMRENKLNKNNESCQNWSANIGGLGYQVDTTGSSCWGYRRLLGGLWIYCAL